jgi:hypothetical protein
MLKFERILLTPEDVEEKEDFDEDVEALESAYLWVAESYAKQC